MPARGEAWPRIDEEAVWRRQAQRVSPACVSCRSDGPLLALCRVPLKPPTPQEVSLQAKGWEGKERKKKNSRAQARARACPARGPRATRARNSGGKTRRGFLFLTRLLCRRRRLRASPRLQRSRTGRSASTRRTCWARARLAWCTRASAAAATLPSRFPNRAPRRWRPSQRSSSSHSRQNSLSFVVFVVLTRQIPGGD